MGKRKGSPKRTQSNLMIRQVHDADIQRQASAVNIHAFDRSDAERLQSIGVKLANQRLEKPNPWLLGLSVVKELLMK